MRLTILFVLLALLAFEPAMAQKKKKRGKNKGATVENVVPQNLIDSVSYSFGVSFANNLQQQSSLDTVSVPVILQAISDVLEKGTPRWTETEATQIISRYFKEKQKREGLVNLDKGRLFLSENARREEVDTTDSGLQYEVLRSGEGESPELTDQVKVHYTGTLIDGTVFDSSVKRGEPAVFPVNAVIRGWVEALQMMKVGDKWKLYIPYDLAYGSRGTRGIPPYSTLIFEVELLEIVK